MKLFKIIIIHVVNVILLVSCMSFGEYRGDIERLKDDEVILVGCFELIPPLLEGEQSGSTIDKKYYGNRMYFTLGDKILTQDDISFMKQNYLVLAKLEENYYSKQKYAEKLYISTPYIPLSFNCKTAVALGCLHIYFPGPFLIEIPKTCKIAYLGKICYYRDTYNEITKIEIRDEFDDTLAEVKEIYGENVEMCRAKVTLVQEE